ncbi:MAG: response regulator transcription factor [Saprospiraceae bacterium]|jgi:DNA-binding NarL/FixJ family response regulator|nr:response regulator transcription factor [Saprospiraceae bacterium]MBP6448028.1 response regulator transcription factor [Saprospiraceae bacterium]
MATRTVLADHQKMFTEGIKAILNELKINFLKIVGIAYSYEELIKMTEMPIDLLILELTMIENNGSSFISELKKNQPNVRIIILSNYGEPHLVREAFINGVDGYVLKTNHSLELAQCIDQVLEGKTYMAEGIRLAPLLDKNKKHALPEKKRMIEDRFLLKQKLTSREKEILTLIVQFKNNKVIAQELYISDQTVSAHRKSIMKKLGVNNTVNLIKFSIDHQLV